MTCFNSLLISAVIANTVCLTPLCFAQSDLTYDQLFVKAQNQLRADDLAGVLVTCAAARKLNFARYECYLASAGALRGQKKFDDAIGMLQLGLAVAPEDKQAAIRASIDEMRAQVAPKAENSSAPTQAEIVLWKTIENSFNAADFRAYLSQYPNGAFAVLAKVRLEGATGTLPNEVPEPIRVKYGKLVAFLRLPSGRFILIPDHDIAPSVKADNLILVEPDGTLDFTQPSHAFASVRMGTGKTIICTTRSGQSVIVNSESGQILN